METVILATRKDFEKEIRESMRINVLSILGKRAVNRDPHIIEFLTRDYISIYDIEELPRKDILSLISNGSLENNLNKLLEAAFSTQFYGGVFPNYINSRKHAFGENDFNNFLATAYRSCFNLCPLPAYDILSLKAREVLQVFRQTTLNLSGAENNIVSLFH